MSVFANGLEVSGKSTPNKTLAAMPDVCLSPPPPPAGPVPIPYPMFGMASDTTDGCTSVFIKGKEAGKKNSTKYSKTTGNEPATNSFGANISSHKITGPLRFAAYSFDVIFEGGGACRFTDLTTQNHMNSDGLSAGVDVGTPAPSDGPDDSDCAKLDAKNTAFRDGLSGEEGKKFNEQGTVSNGYVYDGNNRMPIKPGISDSGGLGSLMSNCICKPVDVKNPAKITYERVKEKVKVKGQKKRQFRWKKKKRVIMDFCDGKCPHTVGGMEAHAELNQLNAVARHFGGNTTGKTVLLSINWRSDGVQQPPQPCTNCQKAIDCICKNKCLTLKICNEKNEPIDRCENKYADEMKAPSSG